MKNTNENTKVNSSVNLIYKTDEEMNTNENANIKEMLENIKLLAEKKGIYLEIRQLIRNCKTISEIKEIRNIVWTYKAPSQLQIAKATNLCNELGIQVPKVSLKHNIAWYSKFITQAIIKVDELPPTEKQMKLIDNMSYCPDIDKTSCKTRKEAREFIAFNIDRYSVWQSKSANMETLKKLSSMYKRIGEEKPFIWLYNFTQEQAEKQIGILAHEIEITEKRSFEDELNEIFRTDFIRQDEEKRVKAEKGENVDETFNIELLKAF